MTTGKTRANVITVPAARSPTKRSACRRSEPTKALARLGVQAHIDRPSVCGRSAVCYGLLGGGARPTAFCIGELSERANARQLLSKSCSFIGRQPMLESVRAANDGLEKIADRSLGCQTRAHCFRLQGRRTHLPALGP